MISRRIRVRWTSGRGLASACLLATLACSEGSAPVAEDERKALDLRPNAAANMMVGDSLLVTVVAVDAKGVTSAAAAGTFTLRSEAPAVASVDARGLVRVHGAGEAWIVLEEHGVDRDRALIRARGVSGNFRIRLTFAADVPELYRAAFERAARRWEETMAGALPPVSLNTAGGDCPTPPGEPLTPPLTGVETGVHIYVGMSGAFPPGTFVEAVGGPCLQRPLPAPTTIFGSITLNRARLFTPPTEERLRYLASHEMGHVLGMVGLVQGIQPEWFVLASGRYTGPMALEGFRRHFGQVAHELIVTPGSHWNEVTHADVMAQGGAQNEISMIAIGAMMDLGYPARWSGAGRIQF